MKPPPKSLKLLIKKSFLIFKKPFSILHSKFSIITSFSILNSSFKILITFFILHSSFSIQLHAYGNYADNSNGTITDNKTGLIWQKCSMGYNNDATCSDDGNTTNNTATWVNAVSYCESLNLASQTDWRLPNVKELKTLVDYSTYNPSINNLFTNTVANYYWSSSTNVLNTSYAWVVNFGYGDTYSGGKTNSYYVRCVRGL